VLVEEPLHVLATVAIILVGKSMAACALVLLMRYPLRTALTVSASLAQIGEFSFILASLGMTLGMLPSEGQSLVLAGAVISIGLNALVFRMIGPLQDHVVQWPAFRRLARRDDPLAELPASTPQSMLSRQVVVVGYGRLGARIGDALKARGVPFVVAEQNREIVERLRAAGVAAVSGDAADPGVLIQAHIARAGVLVTTIDDTVAVRQMVEVARTLNPGIQCVVRTQTGEGAALLSGERVGRILVVEDEVANAMERHVLDAVREGQRQLADADPGHAASREAGRHA
jgi:CPA2 family monovalent cation:H+ antiporter-2